MTPRLAGVVALAVLFFMATAASAQTSAPADTTGKPWIVIGGGSSTVLGDCADCETAGQYRHSGGVLVNAGVGLNSRTDVGAEIFFVPSTTATGEDLRTTFLLAGAQFRFWKSSGFFVKVGAGMGFVKNFVVDLSGGGDPSPPFTSKAFALALGTGWEWRLTQHFGAQVFAAQHVASLGDLEANQTRFENVVGNYFSVGAAIVFR